MHTAEGYQTYPKPSFIETNEVTAPFQEIVNTYGVPMFKEVNPALFTIVTFPFLFGVMFGDIMHGIILLTFSIILCFSERKPGTVMGTLGEARYLFLLMGFFSTYCGFIYNDMTSIPLKVFGDSCYDTRSTAEGEVAEQKEDCVYPFGVDPIWFATKNELNYINSLKMKLSVIFGVL